MEWHKAKLIDVAAKKRWALNGGPFGSKLSTKHYTTSGVPVIRGTNLSGQSKFSFDDFVYVSEEKADELRPNNAHPGDLIFTQRGTIGQIGLIPLDTSIPRFVISQSQMKLTPDRDQAEPLFLYYYFCAQDTVQKIQNLAFAAGVPHINLEILRNFEVPLPPLPVQRRIADILSSYDDLIANNQRRIKILEEMARSLYREWFVHFRFPGHDKVKMVPSSLGPIPQGWEVKKLTDLTAFLSRGISPKYDDEGDSIVINQKCIRDQRLSLDQARRQTKPIPPDKCVRFGDVLINSTGVGTLGRVAQVYEDMERCTVDSHVSIVRPNADTDVDFFGCMLLLKQETFERLGVGATGQTELGRTAIGEVEIPVPPASLLKRFGALIRPTRTAVITLTKQCENLRRTRDLLLPRLLSGQITLAS
jgi:type I restriction enzyme S subunit